MSSDGTDRVQSVRTAWINRMRDEALRMRRPEVSRVVQIGWIIATYADADGSNAYPAGPTIAAIAGCTEEMVTRCVRVLIAGDLLDRRKRPNKSPVYQLRIPLTRIDWDALAHVYGESRQAKARRLAKAAEMAELLARTPSGDESRNPSPAGDQPDSEPVPGGGPTQAGTRPRTGADTVRGRVPEPVPGGGYKDPPTFGRDPHPDHDMAEPGPQPPVGAGAGARDKIDSSPSAQRLDDIAARIVAESAAPPHLQSLPGGGTPRASDIGQRALLLSVSDDPAAPGPAIRGVSAAEREQLRAAGAADIHRVIAAIDELGEPAALALYGGRLVTGAHNERARTAARTHTGT